MSKEDKVKQQNGQEKELLSVIVPVYNARPYLERCVKSIEKQSYSPVEVILVDDGSRDGSLELCTLLAEKYGNIRVFSKQNGGAASARNMGMKYAAGSFIAFVDADDYVEPEMYSEMLQCLVQNRAQIACCGKVRHLPDGAQRQDCVLDQPACFSQTEALRRFFSADGLEESVCDKVFSASVIKDVRFREGSVCEDILFAYESLLRAQRVCHVGQAAYYHYCCNNQHSASTGLFSEQSRAQLEYPRELYFRIKKDKPELISDARRYYLLRLLDCYVQIVLWPDSVEQGLRRGTTKEYYRNFWKLLIDKKVSSERKITALVYAFHLQKAAAWIGKRVRSKRK